MINVENIISGVQNEINDIEQVRIQPGEYIDLFNQSMQRVAQETQMYLGRYSVVPNSTAVPVTTNTLVIPEIDGSGNVLNPFRLERVVRQSADRLTYEETREYTTQAIASDYSGNRAFQGMSLDLARNAYATQFSNPSNNNLVDGSMTLFFTENFALDENIIIDFIQETPFTITKWRDNPSFAVPEFMRTALEAMLLEKVTKRLFNKGDESFGSRYQMARQEAKEELSKVVGYARNFKDIRSPLQIKPSSWLDEARNL